LTLPDPSSHPARLAAALADRYRLERELGQGGMATVYLAEDLRHHRKVAIKVLKPELAAVLGAERFVQEITTTAQLQHPHILPLFDSGTADGFLFYVMPYVQGETLRAKLDREKQLGVEEAVRITREVADALDYAHRRGVIHRDIKPENILLHDGRPMVADFGIALAVSAAAGGRMTETGLSLGTPHYMSPEQATAEKEITARSDVYSLASVLYEMLAGQPPHLGGSAQQIIMKIVTDQARPVTELRKAVPPNVAAALMKALEKLPADRFDSAKAFGDALGNPGFAVGTMGSPAARAPSAHWKDRVALPLMVVAVVSLGAALWGWMRPAPAAPLMRFPISLPDSAQLQQQAGILFALSDDGSTILYTGPGDSDIDLWVRPLDALSATRVPGTHGADSPFLSPDGTAVMFYRNSPPALYRVSLQGGPRQTLAEDSTVALGGSVGPDGSIYFVRQGGLRRLPAGGGPVEEVTRVDTAASERAHGWVDVLPNGKGVLFTILRDSEDQFDIAVLDLKTGRTAILLRAIYARYASTGHIVYANAEGGLFAVPFDEDRLITTGTAIPIVAGVTHGAGGVSHFALSRSGTLLYGTGSRNGEQLLMWVDREGRAQVVDSMLRGPFGDLALSPDGRRVAITQWESSNKGNVWTKGLDHGPVGKLTLQGDNWGPGWTPDGRDVTFVSDSGGRRNLLARRADGSANPSLLLHGSPTTSYGFLSHDGQWLIYEAGKPGAPTRRGLFARRTNGDTTTLTLAASQADEFAPRLSPDGRWLAYASSESGTFEVYVSPFPNSSTSRTLVSLNGGYEPLWARNGRELFYTSGADSLITAKVELSPTFRVIDRTTLFARSAYNRDYGMGLMYDVAPDGRRFIMTRGAVRPASSWCLCSTGSLS
jgi:Tol biopolymer transport system component/tRNA A-37 threonylcarbamoyl transferase component Bud32